MGQAPSRPTPLDARKLAAIAAECATICGLDVRLTPLDEVRVQVVPAMPTPGPPTAAPASGREVACIGVRFDDEYVIVRLPSGGFRALKVDGAGRVVLRLEVRGGFRVQVSRVFGALIWDRLKRGVARYEPRLAQLAAEAAATLVAEAADVAARGPESAPGGASPPGPEIRSQASPPPPSDPPERSAPPVPGSKSEPGPAPGPEPPSPPWPSRPDPAAPASIVSGPLPKTEGAKSPPVPASAPPLEPGAPLARRLRSSRSK